MEVQPVAIGKNEVFIQLIDQPAVIAPTAGVGVAPTGSKVYDRDALLRAREIISDFAKDLCDEFDQVASKAERVSVELSLALTTSANWVFLSGDAQATLKVQIVWNRDSQPN